MQGAAPRTQTQAIIDLLAAHRELGELEWIELRQSVVRAAYWAIAGCLTASSGFLAANILVIACLRDRPILALSLLAAVNALFSLLCIYQVRRLLRQRFFASSRTEVTRDVKTIIQGLT